MIYECEHCEEHLQPNALFCHRCGEKFDEPVPAEATPPPGGSWHVCPTLRGKSAAARATIVLARGSGTPSSPPQAESLLKTFFPAFHRRKGAGSMAGRVGKTHSQAAKTKR